MKLISIHYIIHTFFTNDCCIENICKSAVNEKDFILSCPVLNYLHDYLMRNWYFTDDFVTWGKSSITYGIYFTITTMMVEDHCYVLKLLYLALHHFKTKYTDDSLKTKNEVNK